MTTIGIPPRGTGMAGIMARAAALEGAGFRSLWVGDGYDAFVTASAVATATKQAQIGTGVTLLTRTPVQTMQACAGLDDLSGGRFVLGLGVGPDDWNRDWHGLDPARPARRMAEYVRCLKAAWASTPERAANVDGEIYHLHNFNRMRRSPSADIPVLIGVVGPRNTANAARYADGALFDIVLAKPYVESVGLPAIQAGLAKADKQRDQITVGGMVAISVDPDGNAARRRARSSILLHIPLHYYAPAFEAAGFSREAHAVRQAWERDGVQGALDAMSDDMVAALTVAGTPDEVRAKLREWASIYDLIIAMPPNLHLPPDEASHAYEQLIAFFAAEMQDGAINAGSR